MLKDGASICDLRRVGGEHGILACIGTACGTGGPSVFERVYLKQAMVLPTAVRRNVRAAPHICVMQGNVLSKLHSEVLLNGKTLHIHCIDIQRSCG